MILSGVLKEGKSGQVVTTSLIVLARFTLAAIAFLDQLSDYSYLVGMLTSFLYTVVS